jgi:predicted transcriptional regulator
MNELLHNLTQNLNTLKQKLPTSQYELGLKCPHAEWLRNGVLLSKDKLDQKAWHMAAKEGHVEVIFKIAGHG